jgi:hypothetical protein
VVDNLGKTDQNYGMSLLSGFVAETLVRVTPVDQVNHLPDAANSIPSALVTTIKQISMFSARERARSPSALSRSS